jgi:GMP synthase (glutamine-hydrolysing)
MKTCIALRHVPFESLGLLAPLVEERGLVTKILDVPIVELPKATIADAELVVILGGPISVYEEHLYPFLSEELAIIEQRLQNDRPTIGICLGAQLMARALGARVYPGTEKEIGWSELQLSDPGRKHALAAVAGKNVLHWHGDTYDLPQGATLLASTEITPHQAFSWGKHSIGLQFHLEVAARELEAWYVGHTAELGRWGKIPIPELRAMGYAHAPKLEPHAQHAFRSMLDTMLAER